MFSKTTKVDESEHSVQSEHAEMTLMKLRLGGSIFSYYYYYYYYYY